VLLILALGRLTLEIALGNGKLPPADELTTLALFFIPVLYAALNLQTLGALLTTAWAALLTLPYAVAYLRDGNSTGAWSDCLQIVVLAALALLVSHRVSAERHARLAAERARQAHLTAEIRYHGLFESNIAPILLVDDTGQILEANAAARRVFRGDQHGTLPRSLLEAIGPEASAPILALGTQNPRRVGRTATVAPIRRESPQGLFLLRPTATLLVDLQDRPSLQVVFEDVTTETRRQELAEAYAVRILHAQEEERRHISQELHDGPLQTLIHLCREVDDTAKSPNIPEEVSQPLSALRSLAEEVVAELRSISRGLRPSVLDDLGLTTSLGRLVSDTGSRSHLEVSLDVEGSPRRLPPSVELALFRIAQEALTNVEHHAAARHVDVALRFEPEGVHLCVSDDGAGFEPPKTDTDVRSGSLGLSGMQERAHLAGGSLEVRSSPEGTRIEAWIPASGQLSGPSPR
jgi:signal transduction histidine kinase